MVSVTMPADPSIPPYKPETGIVVFPEGRRRIEQIVAYYDANFRQGQMETLAQFVLEKGHGAMAPVIRIDGQEVHETWQARGRRWYGQAFVAVMEKAVNEYRAVHGVAPADSSPVAPPHILEEIPDPEF